MKKSLGGFSEVEKGVVISTPFDLVQGKGSMTRGREEYHGKQILQR